MPKDATTRVVRLQITLPPSTVAALDEHRQTTGEATSQTINRAVLALLKKEGKS